MDFRPPIRALLLTLTVFGCAHGVTEDMPRGGSVEDSAEIVILRNRNLGLDISTKALLDRRVIAQLRTGEYIRFWASPGHHSLGIRVFGGRDALIHWMKFEQGETYYFVISPWALGMEIEQWPADRAQASMVNYRELAVESELEPEAKSQVEAEVESEREGADLHPGPAPGSRPNEPR